MGVWSVSVSLPWACRIPAEIYDAGHCGSEINVTRPTTLKQGDGQCRNRVKRCLVCRVRQVQVCTDYVTANLENGRHKWM